MSTRTLLGILRAAGIDTDAWHVDHRRTLESMSDAQRQLVAIIGTAAYENGRRP